MPRWLETQRARGADWDLRCARRLHRAAGHGATRRVLALASAAADGPLWVLLFVALWLFTADGFALAAQAAALGGLNLGLYSLLKQGTRRERPFRSCADIRQHIEAPDVFSFPSGHTLHACSYALLLSAAFPPVWPLAWGFALLVGLGRVVLGVHYPSDVLAGALIGIATAHVALAWV